MPVLVCVESGAGERAACSGKGRCWMAPLSLKAAGSCWLPVKTPEPINDRQ